MRNNTNPYYHPEEDRQTPRRTSASSYAESKRREAYDQNRSSPYEEKSRSGARGSSQSTRSSRPVGGQARPAARKRRKKKTSWGRRLFTIAAVLALVFGGGYFALNRLVTGGGGALSGEIATPEEIKSDVVNILCAGIDYEEGRDYTDGMGMTDVVLYVSYDVKANKISMLQIPRDTYVGKDVPTGKTGKINAVARFGDTDPAIEALANLVNEQFKLPIDNYITIDMDAFKAVINAIGGIEVTIPFDITDDFGNTLSAGTRKIDGNTAEFMVRQRHNYKNADIGRLEMQRYMYSALLKTFKSFPVKDILKVMPAYIQYVKTDITLAKMGALAIKIRGVPSENIVMMTMPCEATNYNGLSVVSCHLAETAEMLNTYFRPYSDPVAAESLGAIELANTTTTVGNAQSMDSIDNGSAQWGQGNVTKPAEQAPSAAPAA